MGLFDTFRAKKRHDNVASQLYVASVDQARSPAFFTEMGVPDSVDGRFDLIILHTMLLIRRLRKQGAEAAGISQALLNLMFADMDRNLREMGVGDLSVGRQVKKMAKAFYGRSDVVEKGLDDSAGTLATALKETVYRSAEADPAQINALAAYMMAADAGLKAQPTETVTAGNVVFDAPNVSGVTKQQPAA